MPLPPGRLTGSNGPPKPKRWLLIAIIFLPWCWLFGQSLIANRTLAFRDAAHFHYPTFHWNTEQWHDKQIPLWNSQENLGSPSLSDMSSSLLYPPKLVFQLPLPFPRLYNWYIALHFLLATYGTYRLSRYWQASCWGAAFAALSYGLSGSLVSQHANVIYLVSAAWLPFALQSTDQMLVHRNWKSALLLAVLLSMMTLGGDPQSAYHVGLLAGLYALILWRDAAKQRRPVISNRLSWFQHRFILLMLAGSATFLLCAVQILPTLQWSQQSQRKAYSQPHSLYEIPTALKRDPASATSEQAHLASQESLFTSLWATPAKKTHHRQIYHFSVGPWRFVELVWPNLSGKMYPVHRRWINQLPAEGRVWSPALYLGFIPLLLACAAWSLRSSDLKIRWLSYLVLIGGLASLGWFGLGWLLHEVQTFVSPQQPASLPIGQPVGGLYWLLVQVLPGYVQFRYPAKWFVIASLGLSLLAGKQFDVVCQEPGSRRLRHLILGTTIVSGLGFVAVLLLRSPIMHQFSQCPAHPYWGPLNHSLAIRDILQALGQTALISLCCCWLFRKPLVSQPRWVIPGILCLTALEITCANSWLVVSAADQNWQATKNGDLKEASPQQPDQHPVRIYHSRSKDLIPPYWSTSSSPLRHEEIVAWDRQTLLPRHHLLSSYGLVNSPGSLQSRDYHMLWKVARAQGKGTSRGRPDLSILRVLGVDYQIVATSQEAAGENDGEDQQGQKRPFTVQFQHLSDRFPRVWINHEIIHLQPLQFPRSDTLQARTEAVYFPDGKPRNFREVAVVESDDEPSFEGPEQTSRTPKLEHCRIVDYRPQRVTIEAQLNEPGLVVLSDTYDTNWQATVTRHEAAGLGDPLRRHVYRTNRVMRGVYLPAGTYQIVYEYHPVPFWTGSAISLIAWLGLAGVALIVRKRAH